MGEKHQWNSTHIPPPAVGGDEEEQALLIVCLLASCPSPTTSFSLVSISTIQSKKGSLLAAKRSHSSLSLSSLFYLSLHSTHKKCWERGGDEAWMDIHG